MPIYEYHCTACDRTFEKLVRTMSGEQKIECPACGSTKTARTLSVFAVGAEGAAKSAAPAGGDMPMCGRCGGPGPCAMGD